MSSNSLSSAGKMVASIGRFIIRFLEQFVKEAKIQIKWAWKKHGEAHKELVLYHTNSLGYPPPKATNILLYILLGLIGFFLLKFLMIWAAFKALFA